MVWSARAAAIFWPTANRAAAPAFLIYLPSAEDAALREGAGAAAPAREWETLLIVEDEENVRKPPDGRSWPPAATTSSKRENGAEAIRVSQSYPGPIHLMVTDILMDGMSGVELAERLAFKRPEMRVLFATGYPAGLAENPSLGRERTRRCSRNLSAAASWPPRCGRFWESGD